MLMLGKKLVSPLCMPYAGFEKATNCVLEIPQNIKLELSNNVLTAKAGCIFVLGGNTYSTTTNSSDLTLNIPTTQGRYVISPVGNYRLIAEKIERWGSGDTLPAQGTGTALRFFKTDERTFYNRGGGIDTEWGSSSVDYPICIIDVDSNGVASFAKDSNGNDIIFNGAGFIGHHAFVYPDVKFLSPNGFDLNGNYLNINVTTNTFVIAEMLANPFNALVLGNGQVTRRKNLGNFKSLADLPQNVTQHDLAYINDDNIIVRYNGTKWVKETGCVIFVDYNYNGTTVTDFAIKQPLTKYRWVVKLIP